MIKKKVVLNSAPVQKLKKRKISVLKNKILFYFSCFLIIFVGLIFLSRWQKINIIDIQISGNKITETDKIKEIVQKSIEGDYLWLFPKTNFVLYPKSKIKNELVNKFKIFKAISVSVKNTDTLEINVTEREKKYVWCGDDVTLYENSDKSKEDKCYFVDENGYIFDNAPYFSGNVYFKFFGGILENLENPIGYNFSKENFGNISSLIELLKQTKAKTTAFSYRDDGDINIYLSSNVSLADSPKIIIKKDFIPEKIIENLDTILSTEPLQAEFVKKYSSLLYIDLRFGNKVYYKFK